MWLRKYFLKLRSKYALWSLNRKRKNLSEYEIHLCHLMCLEPELFSNLNVAKACVYLIETDFRNLAHALTLLTYANNCLTAKRQIELPNLDLLRKRIALDKLFVDDKARYLPVVETIERFKNESINFLNKYQELSNASIGIDGYNKRVLFHLRKSMLEFVNELREYTYD